MAERSVAIGAYEMTPVFDGRLRSGLDKIPREADRAAAAALLEQAPPDVMVMDVFAFLLRGPDGLALIDAGTGRLKGPQTGHLWTNLGAAGAAFEDVRRIYITHIHADHVGGLTDDGIAMFPNAEIVVAEPEARFWLDTPLGDMPARAQKAVPAARAALAPYRDRLRVTPKDGSWAGLTAVPSPGHTPGHTSWLIRSQGASALAWGDVVHVPALHLARPRTGMDYDLDPDQAGDTRIAILDWVARERILVAGAHIKSPPFAYIAKEADRYRLERP